MNIKITECPRDAIQGISSFISTDKKIEFYNTLLKVGFDFIDMGSFVSEKIIPQMSDTGEVIKGINIDNISTKILVIVANYRGANEAVSYNKISCLGYPFSISEIFQKKNTNNSILDSLKDVNKIYNLCQKTRKELVIYLSMAFGNPYFEHWSLELVDNWVNELYKIGVKTIMLSDTVGVAQSNEISLLFKYLKDKFTDIEFGVHLHSNPLYSDEKLNSALNSGCRRFDSVIMGYGGCPMAQDNLIGNIDTCKLLSFLNEKKIKNNINFNKFKDAIDMAVNFYK